MDIVHIVDACLLDYKDMQADHVIPLRVGGNDDISNMLPACRSCNHYKAALDLEKFREYVHQIQHYGKNNQSTVCMEECAELIQAISKAKRGKINRDNMIEEIADVLICIEMLKQMYMISDEKINNWIEKKQAREVERMEKNE